MTEEDKSQSRLKQRSQSHISIGRKGPFKLSEQQIFYPKEPEEVQNTELVEKAFNL